MEILENISLKRYNSFGIHAYARYFSTYNTIEALKEILTISRNSKQLILGGGSNILFTRNYDGYVLHNKLKGIEVVSEDSEHVYVRSAAGENWHELVQYCIQNNYGGLENLSLIPGSVGASPMQNIGAYGVEIKDVFHCLDALHKEDHSIQTFTLEDCAFGYRESIFKKKYANTFVILNVTYKLKKHPEFNISYGAIQQELEAMQVKELTIQTISQAVINIRSSKLPDPEVIGNAGSFFKNPTIDIHLFDRLKMKYPEIPGYVANRDKIKVAAGWLIEQCGWKGYREGDAGCHNKQALVLVNYGNAKGEEIYALSEKIALDVYNNFEIKLEREVNIL